MSTVIVVAAFSFSRKARTKMELNSFQLPRRARPLSLLYVRIHWLWLLPTVVPSVFPLTTVQSVDLRKRELVVGLVLLMSSCVMLSAAV